MEICQTDYRAQQLHLPLHFLQLLIVAPRQCEAQTSYKGCLVPFCNRVPLLQLFRGLLFQIVQFGEGASQMIARVVPAFHCVESGLGLPDHGLFPQPMGIVGVGLCLLSAADLLALMDHVVASLGFPSMVGWGLDLGFQDSEALYSPGGQLR